MKKLLLFVALLCPLAAHAVAYTATTTGNWNSATTWGGAGVPGIGDTATCSVAITITVTANTTFGTSPASGNVLTHSGSCIIALSTDVILTIRGGHSKLGTFRRAARSAIVFDSQAAASPTATPYGLDDNGVWTDDATNPPTNTVGTSFTITVATTLNSGTITVSSTSGVTIGSPITGNGIPPETFVTNISPFQISNTATATATGVTATVYPFQGFALSANTSTGSPLLWTTHTAGAGISGFNASQVSNCGTSATVTGTTTNLSTSITGVSPATTPPLYKFQIISGPGLPVSTVPNPEYISSISGSTITVFVAATASATVSLNVVVPCLVYQVGGSGVVHLGDGAPVSFTNTYGIYFENNWGVSDSYNMDITTRNTQPLAWSIFIPGYSTPAGGVVRQCINCVFDTLASTLMTGATWNSPIFFGGRTGINPGFSAILGTFNDPIFRYSDIGFAHDGGLPLGDVSVNRGLLETDQLLTYSNGSVQSPTPFRTGTLTTVTTTVLTDSAASFPSNMHGDANTVGWTVCVNSTVLTDRCRLIASNTSTTMTLVFPLTVTASVGATYTVYDPGANPHFTSLNAPNTGLTPSYEHNIGWYFGADGNGDYWHSPNTNDTVYNFDYGILLANVGRDNSGTFGTFGNNNVSNHALYSAKHNAYFTGHQSLSLYEGFDHSNSFTALQSNIAWADPTVNYVPGGGPIGPYKVDVSVTPSATPIDIIDTNCFGGSASCGDYNAGYGVVPNSASGSGPGYCSTIVAGCNQGYNVNSSVVMGTHDVDNVNPGWSNRWADPITWGYSLGLTNSGDPFQDFAQVLNCMMKVNDPMGYNTACSPTGMYNYFQTVFTPTNVAYHGTAADMTDIGPVPYMAPSVPNFSQGGASKIGGASGVQ